MVRLSLLHDYATAAIACAESPQTIPWPSTARPLNRCAKPARSSPTRRPRAARSLTTAER